MVEDRVTDPVRVGQLLASELTGREDPPFDALSVVDADRNAEPSPDGTEAYGVAADGDRVGTVSLYPERVTVTLTVGADRAVAAAEGPGLSGTREGESTTLAVDRAAAVKRAADAVGAAVDSE
jgi:hypothetical protein